MKVQLLTSKHEDTNVKKCEDTNHIIQNEGIDANMTHTHEGM